MSAKTNLNHLTDRERQIVDLIVHEHSTNEIAQMLFLGTETIKTHRKKIMLKLDVKNVAGIVREAIVQNLTTFNHSALTHLSAAVHRA